MSYNIDLRDPGTKFNISLASGGELVYPSPATANLSVVAPTVYEPFTYTPAQATAEMSVVAPTVQQGVYLYPATATSTLSGIDPTISGAWYLYPDAVTAILTAIDPTFFSFESPLPATAELSTYFVYGATWGPLVQSG